MPYNYDHIPGSGLGNGFAGDQTYYYYSYVADGYLHINSIVPCSQYCVPCTGGWSGGPDVWYYTYVSPSGVCPGCCDSDRWMYYKGGWTIAGQGANYDYDCDGIKDNVDTQIAEPGSTGEKWRLKTSYVRKSDGVTYNLYEGDMGHYFYTASNSSGTPDSFPATDYTAYGSVYYGNGGYKNYNDLGFGTVGNQAGTSGGTGGPAAGGTTPTASSGGKATGGYSGNSDTQGSTTDYTKLLDFAQGIQKNTKDTASNLIELQKSLEKIAQNQATGGVGGSAQIDSRPNIDAVKTSVDAGNTKTDTTNTKLDGLGTKIDTTNTKLEDIKGKIDTTNTNLTNIKNSMPTMGTGDLPDGDVEAIQDESSYSPEQAAIYQNEAQGALASFFDDFIANNPIISWINSSGFTYGGASSSVSFSICGRTCVLSAAWVGDQLDANGVGNFFLALCGLAGVLAILRD